VPVGVIVAEEKCVEGISMRWEPFLLNQFLIDCTKQEYRGMEFHYPWLIIFIAFTAWEEQEDAQFSGLRGFAAKHYNFQYTFNKKRYIGMNVEFFLYG
jgi:hypothetical protein